MASSAAVKQPAPVGDTPQVLPGGIERLRKRTSAHAPRVTPAHLVEAACVLA